MANSGQKGDATRRRIATLILSQMITTGGDKTEKVKAAVDYADLLIEELKKPAGRRLDERTGLIPHGRRRTNSSE